MDAKAHAFLKDLLNTPSPSGYEQKAQSVVRDYVASFADEVKTDLHGNVIVGKNVDAPLRVLLAGHCDQIGLIVTHIDDNGFIYVLNIGGWEGTPQDGNASSVFAKLSISMYLVFPGVFSHAHWRKKVKSPKYVNSCANLAW